MILFISLLCAALNFHKAHQSGEFQLKIDVQGVSNAKGNLGVLLFNQKDGFPSDHTKAFRQTTVAARKGNNTIVFDHVPPGTYAVAIMHDENKNLRIDTNWLGIPNEGYGFSGNKIGLMGPPTFSDAAVKIEESSGVSVIKMRY